MRFLYIGSNDVFSRHELGFISALSELGRVDVVMLNSRVNVEKLCIGSDNGVWDITLYKVPCRSPMQIIYCEHIIKNIIDVYDYDLVVATPRLPVILARKVLGRGSRILLRLWSIRAAKLRDNLRFGAYEDIAIFVPSIAINMGYILYSTYSITIDHATYTFAIKTYPLLRNRIAKLYPPYGFKCDNHGDEDKYAHILDLAKRGDYVLGFTGLHKTGPYLKFEAKPHAIVLYLIAKKTKMNVVLAGSTYKDWKRVFPHIEPPRNLYIVGRGFGDSIVRKLYEGANLVVAPITNRNISNRLLESLFHGAPTITTDVAKTIHPELVHERHAFISNWNNIMEDVLKLLNSEEKLEMLSEGAKEAYSNLFSTKNNVKFVKKIVKYVITSLV
uniref:Glycosyltransferase n=1 Tax=Ignisphaera aggregans TaxID=334771 RepID=A0A7C4BCA4_9CREN